MILNNRYENARRKRAIKIWGTFITFLLLLIALSIYTLHHSRQRVMSETARAEFEKKVFPYSLVYGYVKNFIIPVVNTLHPHKCVFIIAMPHSYDELSSLSRDKLKHVTQDANELGWELKGKKLSVKNWSRPLSIHTMHAAEGDIANTQIIADMATTVTVIKAVVDYLIQDSPYYSPENKEQLTTQYIQEFQNCVLKVVKTESHNNKQVEIHFAHDKASLKAVLKGITKKEKPPAASKN